MVVCRGGVGLWHDDLGPKVKKNHIARDYYTATVSATAASKAATEEDMLQHTCFLLLGVTLFNACSDVFFSCDRNV